MASIAHEFMRARFSTSDVPAKERILFWKDFLGRSILNLEFDRCATSPSLATRPALRYQGLAAGSESAALADAVHQDDLIALCLGADREAAEFAKMRGLREAWLRPTWYRNGNSGSRGA